MENVKVKSFLLRGKKYHYPAVSGVNCIQNTGINGAQEKKAVHKQ
jgi:hypothetical protein